MLLDLHHEVMQVDELRADCQAAEGGLVENLVEAVVVLDELGEGALQQEAGRQMWGHRGPPPPAGGSGERLTYLNDAGAILEVGEGPHDLLTHGLHRLLPAGGKASDQLGDTCCRQADRQVSERQTGSIQSRSAESLQEPLRLVALRKRGRTAQPCMTSRGRQPVVSTTSRLGGKLLSQRSD